MARSSIKIRVCGHPISVVDDQTFCTELRMPPDGSLIEIEFGHNTISKQWILIDKMKYICPLIAGKRNRPRLIKIRLFGLRSSLIHSEHCISPVFSFNTSPSHNTSEHFALESIEVLELSSGHWKNSCPK